MNTTTIQYFICLWIRVTLDPGEAFMQYHKREFGVMQQERSSIYDVYAIQKKPLYCQGRGARPLWKSGIAHLSVVGLAEAASTSWNGGKGGGKEGGAGLGWQHQVLHMPSTKRSWPNLVGESKVAPLTTLFCMSNSCYPTTVPVKRRKITWERPNSYRHNCCLFAYTATVILQLTNLICGL